MALTPMRAIRAKCVDCCAGSRFEVKLCTAENCPLHPYRFGKRPKGYTDTPEIANEPDTLENLGFPTAESKQESPLA